MKKNRLIKTTACAMALSAALTVSAFAAAKVPAFKPGKGLKDAIQ